MNAMTTFRALRVRNFRLWYAGQAVSLTGTWMQQVAQGWLMYRLTESPLLLGLATFAARAPVVFLSFPVGALTERADRRKVILGMQVLALVQALGLGMLVVAERATPGVVIAFALLLGLINAVDFPVRQAFVGELVPTADVPSAVGLASMAGNAARIVGPALAGLLVAAVGEGYCFLLNAASYLAVLIGLLRMSPLARTPAPATEAALGSRLREGAAFMLRERPVRRALLTVAVVSFCGMPYVTLMPAFARDVLRGDAATLGWLMAAGGLGAVIGAVNLASRRANPELLGSAYRHALLMGTALVAFSFTRETAASLLAMVVVGYGMILSLTSANTYLQTHVPSEVRGRVMSMYTIAFVGVAPFGGLAAGWAAEHAPLVWVLGGSGALTVVLSALVAWRHRH